MPSSFTLDSASFRAGTAEDAPVDDILGTLETIPVVRIRGLFDPENIRAVVRGMAERFDPAADVKHDPADTEAIRHNLQKIVIGGITGGNGKNPLARCLRMFFNPIYEDDIHGMRENFKVLARLRNRVFGMPIDYAVEGVDDGHWTASRIHQYPRGGGFMVPHRDANSRSVVDDAGARYAQLFIVMSKKGEAFQEGGAFAEIDGDNVYYEHECEPGDVIVYNGAVVHGVGDIDPMAPFDLQVFSGRVVAFASLYRQLTPGKAEYGAMLDKAYTKHRGERV